jgi:hypothetical protein
MIDIRDACLVGTHLMGKMGILGVDSYWLLVG